MDAADAQIERAHAALLAAKADVKRAELAVAECTLRACIQGCDWREASGEVREQLGYMPEHYGLYTDLSVNENLRFFGNLFDLSAPARHHAATSRRRSAGR